MEKVILGQTNTPYLVLHHALLVRVGFQNVLFTFNSLEKCFTSATDFHGADLSGGRKFGVTSSEDCQKICKVHYRIFL